MMKIKGVILSLVCVCVLSGLLVRSYIQYTAHQARFNTDVLERMLKVYHDTHGQYPQQIGDLPAFHVIQYKEGLQFKSQWLKADVLRGYTYHYSLGGGRYVLSVSPIGWLTANAEFGAVGDGLIRVNDWGVDAQVDHPDEVKRWQSMARFELIHSIPITR